MAVIAVNAPDAGIERSDDVLAALDDLPLGAAVTVMTHGYRYDPRNPDCDPHARLFSTSTRKSSWKSISWAHYLQLDRPGSGLGIGFGWRATGRLDQAATRAFRAGDAMGGLITLIARTRPDLRIGIIAHSLGARVALRALEQLDAGSVDTVLLLSGAEFRTAAARAASAPAGRTACFVNVTSRENFAFDALFRMFAPGRDLLAPALSAGMRQPQTRWTDLRNDDARHLAGLRSLGYRPSAPNRHVCHWSSYNRPGLFPLYRDLLGRDGWQAFNRLGAALPDCTDAGPAPRAMPILAGRTARP